MNIHDYVHMAFCIQKKMSSPVSPANQQSWSFLISSLLGAWAEQRVDETCLQRPETCTRLQAKHGEIHNLCRWVGGGM